MKYQKNKKRRWLNYETADGGWRLGEYASVSCFPGALDRSQLPTAKHQNK